MKKKTKKTNVEKILIRFYPVRQKFFKRAFAYVGNHFEHYGRSSFDEPACLSEKNSTGGSDEFRGGYLF